MTVKRTLKRALVAATMALSIVPATGALDSQATGSESKLLALTIWKVTACYNGCWHNALCCRVVYLPE